MLAVIWALNWYVRWVREQQPAAQVTAPADQQHEEGPPSARLCRSLREFGIKYYNVLEYFGGYFLCTAFLMVTVDLGFHFNYTDAFYSMMVILAGALAFLYAINSTQDFGLIDGFQGLAAMISQRYPPGQSRKLLLLVFIPGFLKYVGGPYFSDLHRKITSPDNADEEGEPQPQPI